MTISEIMNTQEITWIMSKVEIEKPYSDEDYTEYNFNGKIPSRMAQKIKTAMKEYQKRDMTFTVTETENNSEKNITVKFGTKNSTANNIMFFYTEERW